MTFVPFGRLLLASTLVFSSLCEIGSAQQTVLSDKILPRDTFLHFSIPSVQKLKQALENSSTGELWADPAFDDFKAEINTAFSSELNEMLTKVNESLGLSLEELLNIPAGEVSLAVSATGNRMGGALFLDYGENQSQIESLLQKAVEELSKSPGLQQASTTIEGTEVTLFNVTSPVAKQTPLAKEFGWFLRDSRLVVSNSRPLLEAILAGWDGTGSQTLHSNPVYAYIMERCQSSPDADMITMYFDPIGLVTKLVQTGSAGEAGMGAGMFLGFLPTLGLNQLKAMGSVAQMNVEGFEGVSRSFIYSEQPAAGAMRIFLLDQVEQAPPEWVKEGVSLYMATRWKVDEAYAAVESLVDMFQGAGTLAGLIEQYASRGPQVHIKNDLIDQLDGNLQVVSAPNADEETPGSDQMLFVVGVRDADKMTNLLTKLASEPGFPGESREFQGATLYEVNAGPEQKFSFTVANSKLMICVGGALLEQVLRNDSDLEPLAETEEYQQIAEHFRSGALAVTYTNPAAQYRSLYDLLKNGKAAENFPGMDDFFERIDFSRLPAFEVIEKYLSPAGGCWIGDDNGVLMEQFSLKRDGEDSE